MTTKVRVIDGHEGSAWMRERVARRLTQIANLPVGSISVGDVIMTPLGHSGFNDPIEDHTCDRCRIYQPSGLRCAYITPRPDVIITIGLCDNCADLEGWPR